MCPLPEWACSTNASPRLAPWLPRSFRLPTQLFQPLSSEHGREEQLETSLNLGFSAHLPTHSASTSNQSNQIGFVTKTGKLYVLLFAQVYIEEESSGNDQGWQRGEIHEIRRDT